MRAGSALPFVLSARARLARCIFYAFRAYTSADGHEIVGLGLWERVTDPTYRFELYASGLRVMGRCQRSAGILRDLESVWYSQ